MQSLARRFLKKVHLSGIAREVVVAGKSFQWDCRRQFGMVDRQLLKRYLKTHQQDRRLHIGCDENLLDGWLNSDLHPKSPKVFHLDAIKPFPLAGNEFDFVFSEHMIEHIHYYDAINMLKEAYRVLRNNGRIRVSTPNLQFLIDLYSRDKTDLQKDYSVRHYNLPVR